MSAARSCIAASLALCLGVAPALADWPAEGKLVIQPAPNPFIWHGRLFEAPNGELVVLGSSAGGISAVYSCTRITKAGDFVAGWDTTGTALGSSRKAKGFDMLGFTPDDSAGFWRGAFDDFSAGPQVVHASSAHAREPDGSQQVGWAVPITKPSPTQGVDVALALGSSDVYVSAGSGYVQRFTRAGGRAAGWPVRGRPAVDSTLSSWQSALLPDEAGGVILFAVPYNGGPPVVGRLDAGGALHAGWPAHGLVLGATAIDDVSGSGDNWPATRLVASGTTHVLALWINRNPSTNQCSVFLQRFSLDGALDPEWPATGLQAVNPDSIANVRLLSDGQGGAHVLWERGGLPRGTHVLADGTFAPGLDGNGVSLLPAGAGYLSVNNGLAMGLAAGPALEGGLYFAWGDGLNHRARWLRADLTPEPGEPDGAILPTSASSTSSWLHASDLADALPDGFGGFFMLFFGEQVGHTGFFAAHISRPSFVGAPPRPVTATLALAPAGSNPVRGEVALRLTLPDERPARLDLFDVNGRRVRTATLQGAGEHRQAFDRLGTLAPGLYLARLTHAAGSRTTRVMLLP